MNLQHKNNIDKYYRKVEKTLNVIRHGVAFTVVASTLSFAAIGITSGMNYAIEKMALPTKHTLEAKLEEINRVHLLQTKGMLYYGDFITSSGQKMRLYDNVSVSDGKIFQNSVIPCMKEGKSYKLDVRSSKLLGSYVVRSIPVEGSK